MGGGAEGLLVLRFHGIGRFAGGGIVLRGLLESGQGSWGKDSAYGVVGLVGRHIHKLARNTKTDGGCRWILGWKVSVC